MEYKAVPGVFLLTPPPPLHPASKAGGGGGCTHTPGGEGAGGQYFGGRQTLDWPLTV